MKSQSVAILIPREVLLASRMTADELRVELALHLYAEKKLGAGKARELAGLNLWDFRRLAASRRIPVHYGEEELEEDLAAFRSTEDR